MIRNLFHGVAVGCLILMGCGSPAPEVPTAGRLPTAADASRTDRVVRSPVDQVPTQIAKLSSTTASSGNPTPDGHISPTVATSDPAYSDRQTNVDQARYAARQQWLAELWAHPDAAVRLQALALVAEDPGDGLETVLEALEDDDEQVRTQAEEIWEHRLAQEEGAGDPVEK